VLQLRQLVELGPHDRGAADHVTQHGLVQYVPQHGRVLASQDVGIACRSSRALTARRRMPRGSDAKTHRGRGCSAHQGEHMHRPAVPDRTPCALPSPEPGWARLEALRRSLAVYRMVLRPAPPGGSADLPTQTPPGGTSRGAYARGPHRPESATTSESLTTDRRAADRVQVWKPDCGDNQI
jgi:hypothetical protein